MIIFQESKLAHKYLDHLQGIEIGGSAHNPFNLPNCKNVDYSADDNTFFKKEEKRLCGKTLPVDIVAEGDNLPLENESVDYVISSHAIEHFFDPIKTLKEWYRVIRKGGYIFVICPHKDRVEGENRPITTLEELISRHEGKIKREEISWDGTIHSYKDKNIERGHWTVWDTKLFLDLCKYLNFKVVEYLDKDDKVGNGFCVIIQK